MSQLRINSFSLFLIFIGSTMPSFSAETPTLQQASAFAVPMQGQNPATAVFLPSTAGNLLLVFSLPTGQIGFVEIPQPQWLNRINDPTPPPTPAPPSPPAEKAACVITVTQAAPAALPSTVAEYLQTSNGSFFAFTVAMVAETSPPENALTWIGRCAGKPLPYTFISTAAGKTLWAGPTPADSAEFLTLTKKYFQTTTTTGNCPNGNCPAQRK